MLNAPVPALIKDITVSTDFPQLWINIIFCPCIVFVAFSYWVAHRIKDGQMPAFLSEGAASVIASICALVFYVAVALAGFIVIRAFYLGLTQKHEHDG